MIRPAAGFGVPTAADPSGAIARGGLAPWQRKRIVDHIRQSLGGSLPVVELAGIVSLSRVHFHRAFKAAFGDTPHDYIVRSRVEQARALMLGTSESLSQIAYACGFADQAHLNRCFRRSAGTTPAAWRRQQARSSAVAMEIRPDERRSRA